MTWQKNINKKEKEKPNQLRSKPTIAFRSNLNIETLDHLKKLSTQKQKANFINQAIEMRYFYIKDKKQFLSQILDYNYDLAKYLLRKIGDQKKKKEGNL